MKWNWNRKWLWLLYAAAIAAGVYAGYVAWFAGDRLDLGAGFASANGRIEGVEIDIAAKAAGRVTAVLVEITSAILYGGPQDFETSGV